MDWGCYWFPVESEFDTYFIMHLTLRTLLLCVYPIRRLVFTIFPPLQELLESDKPHIFDRKLIC